MKQISLITIRDAIRDARERWMRYYQGWRESEMIGHLQKKAVKDIRNDLAALDIEHCSVGDVDAAIGTAGWAELLCDICDKDQQLVVRLGDEPDYEARWMDVCPSCLAKASALASNVGRARSGAEPATPTTSHHFTGEQP